MEADASSFFDKSFFFRAKFFSVLVILLTERREDEPNQSHQTPRLMK